MAPTLFDNPPKPGDLIEIHRGVYEHWAIYVGQNEVVHLIPPTHTEDDVLGLGSLVQYFDSSSAEVKCEKIWDVVGQDQYHVNNLLDHKYQPQHRNKIVRDALKLVGRVLPYNVARYNCEHFVTDLRYGKAESRQVRNAIAVGGAAVAGVAAVALGAALFASVLKYSNKDDNDD
ncbi:phospholipase A and acyltransferase 3-like isoform X2 [Periophthalmus magnuspinnatus]|uniref:phospholipase A and acyltransferase 3-like isoform X2 n=1 Tax=Periophthalmus magnuspinnatus TaxID=409849 RepID=UPI0024371CF2|nr:phospholipase A and acyltransferase 3-like isoform X2 [Periophthalmus magnuspinnatus]